MTKATVTPISRADADKDRARLRDFLHECVASAPSEEADRVREALGLLPPSRNAAREAAAHLLAGAGLSAVLAMLGTRTPFLLSRGEGGACMATVLTHDGGEELVCEGTTPALALLVAHVSAHIDGLARLPAEMPVVAVSARLH